MDMKDNPWKSVFEDDEGYEETAWIDGYLSGQASSLGELTGGSVWGDYHPVENGYAQSLASAIGQIRDRPSFADDSELKDANVLYRVNRYAFDICGDGYRFRVFTLACRPIFPVEMQIDEGIYQELSFELRSYSRGSSEEFSVRLGSSDELKHVFGLLLKSNKLRYILRQLCAVR